MDFIVVKIEQTDRQAKDKEGENLQLTNSY